MSGDVAGLFELIYCFDSDTDELEELLESVEVNSRFGDDDDTPLMYAAKYGCIDCVGFLLSRNNTVISAVNKHGQNAAMIAARNGLAGVVRLLLDTGAIDVNTRDNHGMNLFMHACDSRCEGVVREVLNCPGIDVNACDNYGTTCLMYSIRHFHNEFYEELVQRGAREDMKDLSGRGVDADE